MTLSIFVSRHQFNLRLIQDWTSCLVWSRFNLRSILDWTSNFLVMVFYSLCNQLCLDRFGSPRTHYFDSSHLYYTSNSTPTVSHLEIDALCPLFSFCTCDETSFIMWPSTTLLLVFNHALSLDLFWILPLDIKTSLTISNMALTSAPWRLPTEPYL